MWETTVIESRRRKTPPWTRGLLLGSLVAHAIALLVLLVINIYAPGFPTRTPSMVESYRLAMLPAMAPPPPPPPPPAPRAQPLATPQQTAPPDVAPTVIPDTIPDIVEAPPEPLPAVVADAGVAGGVPGGSEGGVVGGVVTPEPEVRLPGMPLIVPRDAPLPMVALSMTYPIYPEWARLRSIEGDVLVRYRIDKTGRVRDLEVLHPAHKLLTEAAVNAIKYWRFRPLMENGEPIEVVHELTVRFVLEQRG